MGTLGKRAGRTGAALVHPAEGSDAHPGTGDPVEVAGAVFADAEEGDLEAQAGQRAPLCGRHQVGGQGRGPAGGGGFQEATAKSG
jgi:hypothetical protein